MPGLQAAVVAQLHRLGWRVLVRGGTDCDLSAHDRDQILVAEGVSSGKCFRLLVHCLDAAGSWILFRCPAKTIVRPEPLAGIIPLDLSSCNLPFFSQVFVRKNSRFAFLYAEACLEAGSGRNLLPKIAPAMARLRGCFLRKYLDRHREAETGKEGPYFLNLRVVGVSLSTLHPEEVEKALAGNPEDLAWDAGSVALHLPPCRLGQLTGTTGGEAAVVLPAGALRRSASSAFRLKYLLDHLPGIYWVISGRQFEECLPFILSYAGRWRNLLT